MGNDAAWESAGVDPLKARESLRDFADLLTPRGSPARELQAGAAPPDRAAALELLLYDQLPEQSQKFAELVKLEDQDGTDMATELTFMDPAVAQLSLSENVKKAVRFSERLELIPSKEERLRERLRRLYELPLTREVSRLARADAGLAELTEALRPQELRLYEAVRDAQLRARPAQETENDGVKVVSLEFNLFQAIGALVVIAVLAYGTAQLAKGLLQSRAGADQLPVYSMRSGEAQRPR